jgi:hypothetical protein
VIRASLARSLTVMADAFAGAAGRRAAARPDRLQRWQTARAMYRKSVAIWADMAARGMLTSSDDEEAALVSEGLETAETALRRLGAG